MFWVDRSSYAGFRLLPCHYTMKEGERGPFFPKLRVRIKDNNSSPHGKFYRFLFPFSSKFSDLNFASYVLYIYLHTVSLGYLWLDQSEFRPMADVTSSVFVNPANAKEKRPLLAGNTLFHFISENEIIHILMYFIETRHLGLEQESAKYGNATKKGRTSNKIRSNTKLPLGALNKLLKTHACEISP